MANPRQPLRCRSIASWYFVILPLKTTVPIRKFLFLLAQIYFYRLSVSCRPALRHVRVLSQNFPYRHNAPMLHMHTPSQMHYQNGDFLDCSKTARHVDKLNIQFSLGSGITEWRNPHGVKLMRYSLFKNLGILYAKPVSPSCASPAVINSFTSRS